MTTTDDIENEHTIRVEAYDSTIIFDTESGEIYRIHLGTPRAPKNSEPHRIKRAPPEVDYSEIFDGTCLFYPDGIGFSLDDHDIRAGANTIDTLRDDGFGAAIRALRELKCRKVDRAVSIPECMHAAEAARAGLERLGYQLGDAQCLKRSLGMAAAMVHAGIDVEMTIGVARHATDEDEFHAWISYRDEIIAQHLEVRDVYATILTV